MLIDMHIHSTFSDGELSVAQIVDLYGKLGFGAIAITDHLCEQKTFLGKAAKYLGRTLHPQNFNQYMNVLESEKERAWDMYKMVLVPGVEITKNTLSNQRSAHVLVLGVTDYIVADNSIEQILTDAHRQGATTVAAHPVFTKVAEKQTYHLWDRREQLKDKIDLWEVASGRHLFREVFESGLKKIASSDLHRRDQISSWKTKVNCERNQESILENLKNQNVEFCYFDIERASSSALIFQTA